MLFLRFCFFGSCCSFEGEGGKGGDERLCDTSPLLRIGVGLGMEKKKKNKKKAPIIEGSSKNWSNRFGPFYIIIIIAVVM